MKAIGLRQYIEPEDMLNVDKKMTKETIITADNVRMDSHLRHLYAYLRDRKCIESLVGANNENLSIFAKEVLKQIATNDSSWEKAVPNKVVKVIKENKLWHNWEL